MHHRPVEDAGCTRAQQVGHPFGRRALLGSGQHQRLLRAQRIDLGAQLGQRTRTKDNARRLGGIDKRIHDKLP